MSTVTRTLRNLRHVGLKSYVMQMLYIGDTKYGRLVGTDSMGNKFFENTEELPLRTRWVEYAKHDYDAAHIGVGWHAWISYIVDKPPTEDAVLQLRKREWDPVGPIPNYTGTRGAFKTYNTTVPKLNAWEPTVAERR
ncbi:related to nadh-ubiquinone oxidoreductase subunit b17.2 [Cephalotrichum gorgonifer]|uniref:NADH dehydrogenase [ubiquinone] 1 alpha subcomplex subunit n=1 Tax=Cephalotrichum gorgonifer TaxID=2041049 RepID=A0AAE8N5Y9_9PEZI|nr:related to nadh-ubiquinone oxidoreductase subunit b17.2 [Cephalotrichum gorgonifer]